MVERFVEYVRDKVCRKVQQREQQEARDEGLEGMTEDRRQEVERWATQVTHGWADGELLDHLVSMGKRVPDMLNMVRVITGMLSQQVGCLVVE